MFGGLECVWGARVCVGVGAEVLSQGSWRLPGKGDLTAGLIMSLIHQCGLLRWIDLLTGGTTQGTKCKIETMK